jgi:hypothetical protein
LGQVQIGMPSAAATQTVMDAYAAWAKRLPSPLGLGLTTESNSLALLAGTGWAQIMGDGPGGAYTGIDNAALQTLLEAPLASWKAGSRYDIYGGQFFRALIAPFEQFILQSLPKYLDATGNLVAWNYAGGGLHALDAHLIRLNATHASCPATPTGTPTLTATTGGSLATATSGNSQRFAYSFVGSQDYFESQPSAEAAQVALSGANSAYTVGAIQNPIPAGVTKIRCWLGLPGGAAGVYSYLKDVACVAGSAPPAVTISEPVIQLRQDIKVPVFGQVLALPEFALAFLLAFASLQQSGAAQNGQLTVPTSGMLSTANVALGLAAGILGLNNPPQSGVLGQWISAAFTASSVQTANSAANGLQGFLGAAGGVQAHTTAVLDANATLTNINYTFLDAAHPITPQTGTIAGPLTLNLAVDSTVDLAVPAGRIVKTVTGVTVAGAATGTFQFEGKALRAI